MSLNYIETCFLNHIETDIRCMVDSDARYGETDHVPNSKSTSPIQNVIVDGKLISLILFRENEDYFVQIWKDSDKIAEAPLGYTSGNQAIITQFIELVK